MEEIFLKIWGYIILHNIFKSDLVWNYLYAFYRIFKYLQFSA